jgi:hypothetical protein
MRITGTARRIGAAALLAAVVSGPLAAADLDLDRIIGLLNSPVPEALAAPGPVTVVSTGISCFTLPCPYWAVETADDALLVAVEHVLASPDDEGADMSNRRWAALQQGGYEPVAVEGYVIDRPRTGMMEGMQRVLVVTAGLD